MTTSSRPSRPKDSPRQGLRRYGAAACAHIGLSMFGKMVKVGVLPGPEMLSLKTYPTLHNNVRSSPLMSGVGAMSQLMAQVVELASYGFMALDAGDSAIDCKILSVRTEVSRFRLVSTAQVRRDHA